VSAVVFDIDTCEWEFGEDGAILFANAFIWAEYYIIRQSCRYSWKTPGGNQHRDSQVKQYFVVVQKFLMIFHIFLVNAFVSEMN
jgi:hypothetical protein